MRLVDWPFLNSIVNYFQGKHCSVAAFLKKSMSKLRSSTNCYLLIIYLPTQEDVEMITEFSTFISLALHHAKLYDKIRRTENSVAVVQEVRC